MKLASLFTRLGLKKADGQTLSVEAPTVHDQNVAALALSLESIEKSGLSPEERETFIAETVDQFRDAVLKEKGTGKECPPKDEEEPEYEEGDEEEEEDTEGGEFPPTKKSADFAKTQEDDMTPEQIKKYDEAVEAVVVLKAENTKLVETVAKMEAEEKARVRLAKAEKLVAGTGVKAEEVAVMLEKLGDDNATLPALLSALSKAQSDASLFEELGSIGAPTDVVKAAVVEVRKRHPEMTEEQATVQAYRENPEAYAAARAAEVDAIRRR